MIILILSLITTGLYFYRGDIKPEKFLSRFGVYIGFCGLVVAAVHTTCIRFAAILILTVESGYRNYPDDRTTSRPVFWICMGIVCSSFLVGLYKVFREITSKSGRTISTTADGFFLYTDNMASPKNTDYESIVPTLTVI